MKSFVVGSLVVMLVILGWDNRSRGEQVPAPQGELRIVDKHPLNWAWITWNVFEHLMEIDRTARWCRAWRPVGSGAMTGPST